MEPPVFFVFSFSFPPMTFSSEAGGAMTANIISGK